MQKGDDSQSDDDDSSPATGEMPKAIKGVLDSEKCLQSGCDDVQEVVNNLQVDCGVNVNNKLFPLYISQHQYLLE